MSFFRIALFVAFASFFASNAQAATVVDYYGADFDMGEVEIGQTGTITNDYYKRSSSYINAAYGLLPSNSMIRFDYTLTGVSLGTLEVGMASYEYKGRDDYYTGSAYANSNGSSEAFGFVNGISSTPLVLATANMTSPSTGYIIIKNYASEAADFLAMIMGILSLGGQVAATYAVTEIPLPAALPLFGLGLAALTGAGLRRKKMKS